LDSGNWIIDNLLFALRMWNEKLAEIWTLLTQSPQAFKGGTIWNVIVSINGALKAVGTALLVLFFLVGVVKTAGSITEVKRPEHALKLFVRFAIAKGVITYGLDLMIAIFKIVQGVISTSMHTAGLGSAQPVTLPTEIVNAVNGLTFFQSIPVWAVSLIGCLVVIVLAFIMVMSVYGRFFKIYLYTAIAPIPLSTFAGEPTSHIGETFLKSYAAVCLEGAIIVLGCIIFSVFTANPPAVDTSASVTTMVWSYLGELIFNLLVLTGTIKMADRVVREMFGL
jgi:hypothetical protein